LDKEKNKISLGFRKQSENPWKLLEEKVKVGDTVTAKIVRIVPFGAFAEIMPFVDGLIHISQISTERVDKIQNVLSIGQEVEAKVTEIDFEKKKVSLSIKELLEPSIKEEPSAEEEKAEETQETAPQETTNEENL